MRGEGERETPLCISEPRLALCPSASSFPIIERKVINILHKFQARNGARNGKCKMEYGKWEQVPAGEEYVRNNRIKCNRGGGGGSRTFCVGMASTKVNWMPGNFKSALRNALRIIRAIAEGRRGKVETDFELLFLAEYSAQLGKLLSFHVPYTCKCYWNVWSYDIFDKFIRITWIRIIHIFYLMKKYDKNEIFHLIFIKSNIWK